MALVRAGLGHVSARRAHSVRISRPAVMGQRNGMARRRVPSGLCAVVAFGFVACGPMPVRISWPTGRIRLVGFALADRRPVQVRLLAVRLVLKWEYGAKKTSAEFFLRGPVTVRAFGR